MGPGTVLENAFGTTEFLRTGAETDGELLQWALQKLTLTSPYHTRDTVVKPIQYLLDYTLNRFCRWLRILGIDSVLETEEEEKLRTKDGRL